MRSLSALPAALFALVSTIRLPPALADHDGVQIETTTAVTCSRPSKLGDKVAVHYRGTLQSGKEFDSSFNRGQPITFTLGSGQVIKGWDEGLVDMCPGEARTLTIPPELAYGDRGRPPVIPAKATLIFETELVDIVGVKQESISFAPTSLAATATEDSFSIATAPPEPPGEDLNASEDEDKNTSQGEEDGADGLEATPLEDTTDKPDQQGHCHLLGPFALIVQGALGAVAVLSLVYKRWREEVPRPWLIWFFDVSKQINGSVLTHILNLIMSKLGALGMENEARKAVAEHNADGHGGGRTTPNPCSFYLLNLAIDTTLGIPILYLLLKLLHGAFKYTALARPKESIKSGHYGDPPKVNWWLKQSLIYFIGLTGMKLFVLCLFLLLPWLPWVGDWALRWTEGNDRLQIAFAMFVFPLSMNAVQYWIIDNFIMDKSAGKGEGGHGYQQVQGDDGDDEDHDGDDDDDEAVSEEIVVGKDSGEESLPSLKELNPTPIPVYDDTETRTRSGEGSRRVSPALETEDDGNTR